MSLSLQADPLPLRADEHGSIRIGNTRVLLELVIHAYQAGLSAEQIAERFDTLELADIHAVLAYYLRHRSQVEDYMQRREAEAEEIQQRIETELPRRLTREELLARWSARQEP
ncbi:MAG TPA: DUF433 domain-containing protein [Gemmataceae bacterium]|nr:DUF433 domain-containing protein [Gemmataceae bacterium]